jgi:hypothetical protein
MSMAISFAPFTIYSNYTQAKTQNILVAEEITILVEHNTMLVSALA